VPRELDLEGTGLEEGETREEIMLREFIFQPASRTP
jgi:hypothetical protein